MRIRLPFNRHQIEAALFVGLLCGSISAYSVWNHHVIKREGPLMPSERAARAWATDFETHEARACMRWAIDERIVQLADRKRWFAVVRCNTPAVYGRLALAYGVPALLVLAVLFGLMRSKGRAR